MKKKFLAVLSALALSATQMPVFAQTVSLTYSQPEGTKKNESVLMAAYNSEGFLLDIRSAKSTADANGVCTVNMENEVAGADRYKIIYLNPFMFVNDVKVSDTQNTQSPTESPVPTKAPHSESAGGQPAPYPSAYPTQKDAINALALVTDVSLSLDENDEQTVKIDCMYQGRERILYVDHDIRLDNGNELTTLKKGDMIHFVTKLSGDIKSVSLDYRPSAKDIVTENKTPESFQEFLGSAEGEKYAQTLKKDETGYVFGVIQSRGNSSFTLYNADGLCENSIDLSFSEDTIVYVCNMEKSKPEISISASAAIQKSSIVKAAYDDDDNIDYTNENNSYVYALANVIDGDVAEMIIYTY